MADNEVDDSEKTEDPSQRKLDEARWKGDVAKSQEVSTWFVLAAATLVLFGFAGTAARQLAESLAGLMGNAHAISVEATALQRITGELGLGIGLAVGLPFLVLTIAAIAGNLVQHGVLFSLEPIKPKLSKISPLAGFKRLFSGQSLVNFAKGLVKLAVVGALMGLVLWPQRDLLEGLVTAEVAQILPTTRDLALIMLVAVLAVFSVLAGLDLLYQRHAWTKKQRMTRRELKDEYKQAEGDPLVRAKIRQIRMERGRRRMMAQVPDATVVITNPTHFAVALKYEPGMAAPRCVAKGTDALALRIRVLAEEHAVPVVENPPLARALHAAVDLDAEIEPKYYKAVAEIIGYVMRTRANRSWRSGPVA